MFLYGLDINYWTYILDKKVFDVWKEFDRWKYSKLQIELPLKLDIILFGILKKELHKKPYNIIN